MSVRRRYPVLLVALLGASCHSQSVGFGVAVTLRVDPRVASAVTGAVQTLRIASSGDEAGAYYVTLARALNPVERLIYEPMPATRKLTLAFTALDAQGVEVLAGTSSQLTLTPGKTTSCEILLGAATDNTHVDFGDVDFAGRDLAGVDLSGFTPPDLSNVADLRGVDQARPVVSFSLLPISNDSAFFAISAIGSTLYLTAFDGVFTSTGNGTKPLPCDPNGIGGATYVAIATSSCGVLVGETIWGPVAVPPNGTKCVSQSAPDGNVPYYGAWLNGCDAYLVGVGGTIQHETAGFTGAGNWATVTAGTNSELHGIWINSTDTYIVGKGGTILHRVGTGAFKTDTVTGVDFYGVWGISSADLYAIGSDGAIYHSAGDDTWTSQLSNTNNILRGVWASSATDVYAVGDGAVLLHSTGQGDWTPAHIEFADLGVLGDFNAVWGTSATDVYVVGGSGQSTGVVLHHN